MSSDDPGDLQPDWGLALYPAGLRLNGRRVVVAGGGAVAQRRIARLLAAGAVVTLISPEATPALAALAATGDLCWHRRPATAQDFAGACLALICTGDAGVNGALAAAARACGALVNRCDDPNDSDFLVPAVADLAPVQVAVLTGGLAPTVGRYLCSQIERSLGTETAGLVALTSRLRTAVRALVPSQPMRAALISAALDEEVLIVLRSEGLEAAYVAALKKLELASATPPAAD